MGVVKWKRFDSQISEIPLNSLTVLLYTQVASCKSLYLCLKNVHENCCWASAFCVLV